MFWQPADEEFPQRTFHDGVQGAVARSEAFVVDGEEVLDVLAHEPEERRISWPSGFVDSGADLHTGTGAGGREPGESTMGQKRVLATDKCEHRTGRGQARSSVRAAA